MTEPTPHICTCGHWRNLHRQPRPDGSVCGAFTFGERCQCDGYSQARQRRGARR